MINIENYDNENIFSKILRNEIPCDKIFENEYCLAFKDINPQAPIHVLAIPKKLVCSYNDFIEKSDDESITYFFKAIREITKLLNLDDGYRLICNTGVNGGQEVPHLHFHILGKKRLKEIIP